MSSIIYHAGYSGSIIRFWRILDQFQILNPCYTSKIVQVYHTNSSNNYYLLFEIFMNQTKIQGYFYVFDIVQTLI